MKENVILLEEINNLRKEVKTLIHKIKQVENGGDPLNRNKEVKHGHEYEKHG